MRLDSINGINPGTLNTAYTGEWDKWQQFSTDIDKIEGVHDLYMIFKGRKPHELMNLDYWYFSE